jgi:hypothetical protein
MKDKILLASGYIDFYVDKKKYLKYKSKVARFNYVYLELTKILESNIGKNIDDIELRDCSITSNNFWGNEDFCIINDIGFSGNNELEENLEYITLRIFSIDVVGLVSANFESSDAFIEIKDEKFEIKVCSVKLV